jgi:hypothetical protein
MNVREPNGRFAKGVSANPGGRMRGTILAQTALRTELEKHGAEIIAKQIEIARKGNVVVARFLLERLIPIAKSAPIESPVELTGTPAEQAQAILSALAAGEITQDSAQSLLHAVRMTQEISDASEIAIRLLEIESKIAALGGTAQPLTALPAPDRGDDAS